MADILRISYETNIEGISLTVNNPKRVQRADAELKLTTTLTERVLLILISYCTKYKLFTLFPLLLFVINILLTIFYFVYFNYVENSLLYLHCFLTLLQ